MGNIYYFDEHDENGNFKNRYVYIDRMKENGKLLYRLARFSDSESYKIETDYFTIDGDIIKKYLPQNNEEKNNNQEQEKEYEIHEITEELKEKIKSEQIAFFSEFNKMLDTKLDMEKVEEAIRNVDIGEKFDLATSVEEDEVNHNSKLGGAYLNEKNMIILQKINLDLENKEAQEVRFHEFIHLIQDKLNPEKIENVLNEPLVEASAEKLFEDSIEDRGAYYYKKNDSCYVSRHRFKETNAYSTLKSFLHEMEVAMECEYYKDNIIDRIGFYKKFEKKYGTNLLTYITDRMILSKFTHFNSTKGKAFFDKESHDTLFKEIFDREIEAIGTIDGAKKILNKMQKIEEYRPVWMYYENKECGILDGFDEIYDEYFRKIGRKLAYLGYNKEEIINSLEEYRYKKRVFPEEQERLKKYEEREIPRILECCKKSLGEKYDIDNINIRDIIGKFDEIIYEVSFDEIEAPSFHWVVNTPIAKCIERDNVDTEYSFDNMKKTGFKVLLDEGRSFKEVDFSKYKVKEQEQKANEGEER